MTRLSTSAVLAATALLAAAAVVLSASPALAHNRLVSSDPAQGASLAAPPQSITLVFDDAVLPVGTAIEVAGPGGGPVELSAPTVEGDRVVQALPTGLPAGGYSVLWRVTSGDGHPIDGTLTFTAETADVDPEPAQGGTPTGPATAGVTGTATAAPEAELDDGGVGVLPWALLGGAVIAAGGVWLATRRRGNH